MTIDELISKIKENIYSGNRGSCDYFIVDEIEDLIYEYEESSGCEKCIDHSEPKRKTGRWIHHTNWERDGEAPYECDQCGRCFDYKMRFCGFCGAKMEVEHEND